MTTVRQSKMASQGSRHSRTQESARPLSPERRVWTSGKCGQWLWEGDTVARGSEEPCGCSPASIREPRGALLENSSRRTEMKLPVNSPGPLGAGLTQLLGSDGSLWRAGRLSKTLNFLPSHDPLGCSSPSNYLDTVTQPS